MNIPSLTVEAEMFRLFMTVNLNFTAQAKFAFAEVTAQRRQDLSYSMNYISVYKIRLQGAGHCCEINPKR